MSLETINKRQDEVINEFEFFDDWDEKYGYLIELGKNLHELPEEYKTEDKKVKGCQSQVWLHSQLVDDDKIVYEADSDAMIVKGLISLLIRILSDSHPDDIVNSDLYFLDKVGLQQHLSPTRSNGLAAMVKRMKMEALAYKAKLENQKS